LGSKLVESTFSQTPTSPPPGEIASVLSGWCTATSSEDTRIQQVALVQLNTDTFGQKLISDCSILIYKTIIFYISISKNRLYSCPFTCKAVLTVVDLIGLLTLWTYFLPPILWNYGYFTKWSQLTTFKCTIYRHLRQISIYKSTTFPLGQYTIYSSVLINFDLQLFNKNKCRFYSPKW